MPVRSGLKPKHKTARTFGQEAPLPVPLLLGVELAVDAQHPVAVLRDHVDLLVDCGGACCVALLLFCHII